jgi:hypothetical protein
VSVNRRPLSILKVKWPDKISNEELWRRTNQTPIEQQIIKGKKWRLINYTLREPKGAIERHALERNTQGGRKRGKPRITWKRTTEWNCRRVEKAAKELALDRTKWKSIMNVLCSTQEQKERTANARDLRLSLTLSFRPLRGN